MSRHSIALSLLCAALALPMGALAGDKAPAAKAAKDERQCSMPTSPRLQKKGDECAEAKEWSRSHSLSDVRSTGRTDAGEALRRLDPSVY